MQCPVDADNQTTGALKPFFGVDAHKGSVKTVAAEFPWMVSGASDETIRIFNYQTLREFGSLFKHQGAVTCLEFFNSNYLLSGGGDGVIHVWATGKWEPICTFEGHEGPVHDLSVHPSGKLALSVGKDGTLRLWNLMTGTALQKIKLAHRERAVSISWSPLGNTFAVLYEARVSIYSASAQVINTIEREKISVPFLSLTYIDNKHIAIGSEDGKIRVYDLKKSKPKFTLEGHKARVRAISVVRTSLRNDDTNTTALDPEPLSCIASASTDGDIKLWALPLKKKQKNVPFATASAKVRINAIMGMNAQPSTEEKVRLDKAMATMESQMSSSLSVEGKKQLKQNIHATKKRKQLSSMNKLELAAHVEKKSKKQMTKTEKNKARNVERKQKLKAAKNKFQVAKLAPDTGVEPAPVAPGIAIVDKRKKKKKNTSGRKKKKEKDENTLQWLQDKHGVQGGDATEYFQRQNKK
jgi:protein MAK11